MQTDKKQVTFFGVLALVLLLAVSIILMDGRGGKENVVEEVSPKNIPVQASAESIADKKEEARSEKMKEISLRVEHFPKERHNSLRLLALMDEEDMHDEARELAHKMALEGTPEEKADALTAFGWLGGKDAVEASIGMLKAGDEYLERRATDVLSHLIQEDLMRDEDLMTKEMWQSLFNQLQDDTEIESYMVLLGGYSNETSVPVLLELAKSERKELGDKALEHLGSIAYGEEFSTREEAEKWFKDFFEKEANKNRQTQE